MERKDWIRLIIGALAVLLVLLGLIYLTRPTEAKVEKCKTLNAECDVNKSDKKCCPGLTCMSKGVPSTIGKCGIIMPTIVKPTDIPCPTETPTPTVTPTETPEVTLTVTPSPTLEPTLALVESPRMVVKVESGSSSNDAPRCEEMTPVKVTDVWYSDYSVVGGEASLVLHWGLNDDYKNVNIAYGHKPYEWIYGVPLTQNSGSLKIGGLTPYTTYWFQVAYITDSCGVGEYSTPVDP